MRNSSLLSIAKSGFRFLKLPRKAQRAAINDLFLNVDSDPGNSAVIPCCLEWLRNAQDHSRSKDGGIARDYSIVNGWSDSYPETSGYVIPTLIENANNENDLEARSRRVLDWLLSIQMANGAFQGGTIETENPVPVVFNTGQILIGLAEGVRRFGDQYDQAMQSAANWLVSVQDKDGAWRRFTSPFVKLAVNTYDVHVAWGLLEAGAVSGKSAYRDSAARNIKWAISRQLENGWLKDCGLNRPHAPLTHTLGYALRGFLEGHMQLGEDAFLEPTIKLADGLLNCLDEDGYLPGRLDSSWNPVVSWCCMTGTAQVAICWQKLALLTGDQKYLSAAQRANAWLRKRIQLSGPPGIRGGVRGSFPINGGYGRFMFLNWACKFAIDSFVLEQKKEMEKP